MRGCYHHDSCYYCPLNVLAHSVQSDCLLFKVISYVFVCILVVGERESCVMTFLPNQKSELCFFVNVKMKK